jgi:pilus assembly protein Flp/PilA
VTIESSGLNGTSTYSAQKVRIRRGVWRLVNFIVEPLGDRKMAKFVKLLKNSKGATAIEYGLIAALIAVAAIAAMGNIGNGLKNTFNNVGNNLA